MPDFLTNLSQRVLGTTPLVRPRFPSLFASQGGSGIDFAGSEPEIGTSPYDAGDAQEGVRRDAGRASNLWSAGETSGGDRDDLHSFSSADRPHISPDRGESIHPPSIPAKSEAQSGERSLLPPMESENDFSSPYRKGKEERDASQGGRLLASDYSQGDAGNDTTRGISPFDRSEGEGRREEDRSVERNADASENIRGRDAARERRGEKERVERIRNDGPPRLVQPVPGESRDGDRRNGLFEEMGSDRSGSEAFAQRLRSTSDISSPASRDARSDAFRDMPSEESDAEDRTPYNSERSRFDGEKLLVPGYPPQRDPQTLPRTESEATFSPPAIPRNESGKEGTISRTINVTIGRVEVRGTPEPKVRQVPVRTREKSPSSAPVMSLDDYLKRYNRREG